MNKELICEEEAVKRAQQGDADAFAYLYSANKRGVYALCVRMTRGNVPLSEELTQEAFLQMFRKIKTFRGDSAFSTWLHQVTFNVVLMYLRHKFVPEISFDELPQSTDEPLKKGLGTCDLGLEGAPERLNIERVLDDLSPGYRMVLVLHDIYGYEHNEIAEILGCSIGNSKSQLHKARERVRALLNS